MMLSRRSVFALAPCSVFASGVAAWPAAAKEDFEAALREYERESGGRIGVYAQEFRTGATFNWRAEERFVMCSTFKASLAACVLHRIDQGEDTLQAVVAYGPSDLMEYAPVARDNASRSALSVDELCKAAVELSDNTCANLLLARIGGPSALTAFWRSIGDKTSRLDHNEPVLNRSRPGDPHDTTSPMAMAGSLKRLLLGDVLSRGSREQLKRWMVDCQTGGNRLRAGLPKAWTVGDKTGNNGADASGDIAVAWGQSEAPILICTYTQGGAPTPVLMQNTFAAIGRAVSDRFA